MMRSLAILVLLGGGIARADDALPPPWSANVPQTTQDSANHLFAEANALFAAQQHAPAVDKYRAAIALWDHPMIRFNLAVTLVRLARPLEAAEELEHALRYEEKPFTSPQHYQQARDYQTLLRGQLGYIEVRCAQRGVKVLLDGKAWLDCPGTRKERVLTGEHAIVGEQPGHVTRSRRLVVAGGATVNETIELQTLADAVRVEYRFRRWAPWTVASSGAAVAFAGLGLWLVGRGNRNLFEERLAEACGSGCPADFERDLRDRARLQGNVGITMMVVGGIAGVTGAWLVIANRGRRVMPQVDPAPSGATIRASWRF